MNQMRVVIREKVSIFSIMRLSRIGIVLKKKMLDAVSKMMKGGSDLSQSRTIAKGMGRGVESKQDQETKNQQEKEDANGIDLEQMNISRNPRAKSRVPSSKGPDKPLFTIELEIIHDSKSPHHSGNLTPILVLIRKDSAKKDRGDQNNYGHVFESAVTRSAQDQSRRL